MSTLLLIAIFLLWFSPYTYVPILSSYAESVGSSLSMVGMILGSYGFVQLIARIPIGILSDRWNKKHFFLKATFIIGLISQLLFIFFPNAIVFLIARSLAGLSVSHWAIFITSYQKLPHKKDTSASSAIGVVSIFQTSGTLLGMLVGSSVANHWGRPAAFWLGSITSTLGLILVMGITRSIDQEQTTPLRFTQILRRLKDPHLLYYSLLTALMQAVVASSLTGFMPSLLTHYGASDLETGITTTLASLPAVIGGPIALGPMRRHLGLTRTAVLSFICLALGTLPFVWVTSIPWLMVAAFIAGIGKGLLAPLLMAASTSHMDPTSRSTALGAHQAIYSLGMSFGPMAIGVVSQHTSISMSYVILTAISLLGALILALAPIRGQLTN